MISFAKKILTPGRVISMQPTGGESRVRKYSLTSVQEPPSPVYGTSFALNPEHSFVPAEWINNHGARWGRNSLSEETGPGRELLNERMVNRSGAGTIIMWPEASESSKQCMDDIDGTLERNSDEGILYPEHSETESAISSMENISYNSVKKNLNTKQRILNSQFSNNTARSGSLHSITDTVDSRTNVSDNLPTSPILSNIVVSRYQRAKRKQRSREMKIRRKTLESLHFNVTSDQLAAENLTLSPTDPVPTNKRRLRRLRSGSDLRRHTIDGVNINSDATESQDDEIQKVPLFRNVLWPSFYSSSEEVLTDSSKVTVQGERTERGRGLKRGGIYATAVSISDMNHCKVIADLDLLEDDTEFEPCSVPFEDTVVLWPAAVDKPSCFESPRTYQSWISSLEASGFVGEECLLMAPVIISWGTREHAQFIFLFPRHLLLADQRSSSILKLNQKIAVGSLWLSCRKEDMSEVAETEASLDGSRSFILGWPPTNAVTTFATFEEKNTWIAKLEELIPQERMKDDPQERMKDERLGNLLPVKIVYKERGHSRAKELTVSRSETTFQVLQRCLQEFHLNANSTTKDYQLSVKWAKGHSEQPLLGHEFPYVIQSWFLKCTEMQGKEISNVQCLVLRERKRSKPALHDANRRTKASKSVPLKTLFRKTYQKSTKQLSLFGRSLAEICIGDTLPKPILAMFQYLYIHGPSTTGVFRRSARHSEVSDFRSSLNSVEEVNTDNVCTDVVASVLKEWLRKLPDCLLTSDLYNQWIEVPGRTGTGAIQEELKRLSSALPHSHLLVLRHLMCVLHRIQLHSEQNLMTPFNLAVCIGPNILHPDANASIEVLANSVERSNAVVQLLIESIEPVLGQDCVRLYQDIADPYVVVQFEPDGNYEVHRPVSIEYTSAPSFDSADIPITNSMESLDSYFPNEPSHQAVETTGQSLESMSPDSGLALSNPQLFDDVFSNADGKRQESRREVRLKSELSDISECQMAFDSESDSSQASDNSGNAPASSRAHGAWNNTRERVERFQNPKVASEEMVSSFEGRCVFSDDPVSRSESVVRDDVKKNEAVVSSAAPSGLTEPEGKQKMSLGHGNYSQSLQESDLLQLSIDKKVIKTTNGSKQMSKVNKPDVKQARKLQEMLPKELAVTRFRLTSVDIIPGVNGSEQNTIIAEEMDDRKRNRQENSKDKMAIRQGGNTLVSDKHLGNGLAIVSPTTQKNRNANTETVPHVSGERVEHKKHVSKISVTQGQPQRYSGENMGPNVRENNVRVQKESGRNEAVCTASRQNASLGYGENVYEMNGYCRKLPSDSQEYFAHKVPLEDVRLRQIEMVRTKNFVPEMESPKHQKTRNHVHQGDAGRTPRHHQKMLSVVPVGTNVYVEGKLSGDRRARQQNVELAGQPRVLVLKDEYPQHRDFTMKDAVRKGRSVDFCNYTYPVGKQDFSRTVPVSASNPQGLRLNTNRTATIAWPYAAHQKDWPRVGNQAQPTNQIREPVRGMQRSVTVIQLCDNNSVILQKPV